MNIIVALSFIILSTTVSVGMEDQHEAIIGEKRKRSSAFGEGIEANNSRLELSLDFAEEAPPPTFEGLASELLETIFSFLGYEDILNLRYVSKKICAISGSNRLWKELADYEELNTSPFLQNITNQYTYQLHKHKNITGRHYLRLGQLKPQLPFIRLQMALIVTCGYFDFDDLSKGIRPAGGESRLVNYTGVCAQLKSAKDGLINLQTLGNGIKRKEWPYPLFLKSEQSSLSLSTKAKMKETSTSNYPFLTFAYEDFPISVDIRLISGNEMNPPYPTGVIFSEGAEAENEENFDWTPKYFNLEKPCSIEIDIKDVLFSRYDESPLLPKTVLLVQTEINCAIEEFFIDTVSSPLDSLLGTSVQGGQQ